jgi:NAD(P)-dependent dehydrogenase (short-subunit alcohol dehydrogenase family)
MEANFQFTQDKVRDFKQVRFDFSGEVVVVTGAARGQGRAHALAFAEAGADVVVSDIGHNLDTLFYEMSSNEQLEQVAEEIRALGVRALPVVCDVRDDAQVKALFEATIAEFGKVDIVVANAGVAGIVEVTEMTEAQWDELVDTNLKGVFLTAKYAAQRMKAAGKGRIIAIGSIHCYTGVPGSAHYVAAKHGVAGLCKSLAIELAAHGVTVNYVCPTAVNTKMVEAMLDPSVPADHGERLVGVTGSWNMVEEGAPPIQIADVSNAVMYLASDAAMVVTGAPFMVDAGFTAK